MPSVKSHELFWVPVFLSNMFKAKNIPRMFGFLRPLKFFLIQ